MENFSNRQFGNGLPFNKDKEQIYLRLETRLQIYKVIYLLSQRSNNTMK